MLYNMPKIKTGFLLWRLPQFTSSSPSFGCFFCSVPTQCWNIQAVTVTTVLPDITTHHKTYQLILYFIYYSLTNLLS